MNDPMEGIYEAATRVRQQPEWQTAREAIRWGKAETGICSFAEASNNELMWAHYADGFRGMCIEYDLETLMRGLREDCALVRVAYSDEVPQLRDAASDNETAVRAILSTKSARWLYEREWRAFSATRGAVSYRSRAVTRLIMGSRIAPEDAHEIQEVAEEIGVPVHRVEVKGYRLSVGSRHIGAEDAR